MKHPQCRSKESRKNRPHTKEESQYNLNGFLVFFYRGYFVRIIEVDWTLKYYFEDVYFPLWFTNIKRKGSAAKILKYGLSDVLLRFFVRK